MIAILLIGVFVAFLRDKFLDKCKNGIGNGNMRVVAGTVLALLAGEGLAKWCQPMGVLIGAAMFVHRHCSGFHRRPDSGIREG